MSAPGLRLDRGRHLSGDDRAPEHALFRHLYPYLRPSLCLCFCLDLVLVLALYLYFHLDLGRAHGAHYHALAVSARAMIHQVQNGFRHHILPCRAFESHSRLVHVRDRDHLKTRRHLDDNDGDQNGDECEKYDYHEDQ